MRTTMTLMLAAIVVAAAGCGGGNANPPPGYTITADGFIITPSGLRYKIERLGTGPRALQGNYLTVDYEGWLDDGTVFDSSEIQGKPFQFTIGEGAVIAGWDQGLLGLPVGTIAQLIIPSELGYGSQRQGVIPPYATLHFRVEILSAS